MVLAAEAAGRASKSRPARGSREARKPEHETITAHRVEGTPVFNTAGERIGKIDDLMIEKVSGKVTSAVMSFGSVLGVGGGRYPIPWPVLAYDPERKGYVVDEAKLEHAPKASGEGPEESDLPWRREVYNYWAVMPYW